MRSGVPNYKIKLCLLKVSRCFLKTRRTASVAEAQFDRKRAVVGISELWKFSVLLACEANISSSS